MKGKFLNILLSIASVLIAFVVLELAARIYKGEFHFKNFLDEKTIFLRSARPAQYDPELGWIPKVGTSGKENEWGTTVTILQDGIRSNGGSINLNALSDSAPILVVGGSFTFGDQVSDNETYSAMLEKLSGKKVLNAGVFGYGTDQVFLRAERLIKKYKPDTLIFDVMSDHILRCELAERDGVSKPYFEIKDDKLILKNIPVPPPSQKEAFLSRFRKIFGYSFLVHKIMMRVAPGYWLQGRWHNIKVHSEGEKVACLIFKKLEDIAVANSMKIYVLFQYHDVIDQHYEVPLNEQLAMMDRMLHCLQKTSLKVVDLKQALLEMKERNKDEYKSMYKGHMTAKGNYFVASKLLEVIRLR